MSKSYAESFRTAKEKGYLIDGFTTYNGGRFWKVWVPGELDPYTVYRMPRAYYGTTTWSYTCGCGKRIMCPHRALAMDAFNKETSNGRDSNA